MTKLFYPFAACLGFEFFALMFLLSHSADPILKMFWATLWCIATIKTFTFFVIKA